MVDVLVFFQDFNVVGKPVASFVDNLGIVGRKGIPDFPVNQAVYQDFLGVLLLQE